MEKGKAWDEYVAYIKGLLRSGEVKLDNDFLLISDGEVVQIVRADFLPYSAEAVTFTLDTI